MMNGPKFRFFPDVRLYWNLLLAGCGMVGAMVSAPVMAAEDEIATAFSIPAQPLADALNAFGEATHIPMFVDSALTVGRRSSEVVGTLAPYDALRGLLAGTGLAAKSVAHAGFTLSPVRTGETGGPGSARPSDPFAETPAALRFDRYSATIQRALHELLCRHRETQPGTFRTLVRLWIGATGRIVRSEVLTSTGDVGRDGILAAGLRDLAIDEPPPPDLQQPVTLLLLPTTVSAADYCLLSAVEQAGADLQ